MVPISIDIRRLEIIKFQDGWSQRKIAMNLNISRHGVQSFNNIKLWKTFKNLVDRKEMMTGVKNY